MDSDDREKLLGFLEEKPKVGTLVEMMKDDTGGLDEDGFEKGEFHSDLAGMMLENFDEADHTYFKVEKAPEQTYHYSDLIEPYLDSRSNEASKEVTSRRLACNRVLEYVGDLPLAEYASIHAYDMAKAMDSAGYSKAEYPARIIKRLKDEIIERAEYVLAANAPKAVLSMVNVIDDPSALGNRERLAASKEVLDRVGLAKREKVDINAKVAHGIFILPPKENV